MTETNINTIITTTNDNNNNDDGLKSMFPNKARQKQEEKNIHSKHNSDEDPGKDAANESMSMPFTFDFTVEEASNVGQEQFIRKTKTQRRRCRRRRKKNGLGQKFEMNQNLEVPSRMDDDKEDENKKIEKEVSLDKNVDQTDIPEEIAQNVVSRSPSLTTNEQIDEKSIIYKPKSSKEMFSKNQEVEKIKEKHDNNNEERHKEDVIEQISEDKEVISGDVHVRTRKALQQRIKIATGKLSTNGNTNRRISKKNSHKKQSSKKKNSPKSREEAVNFLNDSKNKCYAVTNRASIAVRATAVEQGKKFCAKPIGRPTSMSDSNASSIINEAAATNAFSFGFDIDLN